MNFAPFAPAFLTWIALGCVATSCLTARAQPPAWPDTQLVANGCYLSTTLYLRRLAAEHPGVEARPENVRLPSGRLHTVALVQWEGRAFLRDMFIGVAPMRGDVQRSFDAALAAWRRIGGRHGFRERSTSTAEERRTEVEIAAHLLAPHPTQIVIVLSSRGPIPVLCWQTAEGALALYEPSAGTAVGFTERTPLDVATFLFGTRSTLAHREIVHAPGGIDG